MTAIADALTLSGRQLLRLRRYPSLTVTLIALPLVLLLVFTFVFGGTLGAGISGADIGRQGRAAYLDYIVPGLLLLALADSPITGLLAILASRRASRSSSLSARACSTPPASLIACCSATARSQAAWPCRSIIDARHCSPTLVRRLAVSPASE